MRSGVTVVVTTVVEVGVEAAEVGWVVVVEVVVEVEMVRVSVEEGDRVAMVHGYVEVHHVGDVREGLKMQRQQLLQLLRRLQRRNYGQGSLVVDESICCW